MKLYRLPHSPFARKVQMLLDLLGRPYTAVDLPFSDRTELATLTGGYIQVPVLVDDDGKVVCDSRKICEHLLVGAAREALVPAPLDGPVWAYADWCDGPLEDVVFRIFSPQVRAGWKNAGDRALYVFIKERKFGVGCVDAWARDRQALLARAAALLAPSVRTLEAQSFLFGARPSLADAALYGVLAATLAAEGELPAAFRPLAPWMQRLEQAAPR
jgi:glutathione S-transferase